MQHLVKETVKRTGRLDYIFNNAGIVIGAALAFTVSRLESHYRRQPPCVINGVQAAYKIMVRRASDTLSTLPPWLDLRTAQEMQLYSN